VAFGGSGLIQVGLQYYVIHHMHIIYTIFFITDRWNQQVMYSRTFCQQMYCLISTTWHLIIEWGEKPAFIFSTKERIWAKSCKLCNPKYGNKYFIHQQKLNIVKKKKILHLFLLTLNILSTNVLPYIDNLAFDNWMRWKTSIYLQDFTSLSMEILNFIFMI
jgi:hypothetical protein